MPDLDGAAIRARLMLYGFKPSMMAVSQMHAVERMATDLAALLDENERLRKAIEQSLAHLATVGKVMDGKVLAQYYQREWATVETLRAALDGREGV